jgi:hypothetical protein
MRVALAVFVAVASAACVTRPIDLGGGDGGTPPAGFTPTTIAVTTCASAPSTSAVQGDGFNGERPAACDAPRGATHAVASPADVAASLVGLWYDCTHHSFGIDFGQMGSAVELTNDGHYRGYGYDPDKNLLPLDALPGDPYFEAGHASTPASTGTFTVVDGSATYGAGTYELQLHPNDGGLFRGQVLVTDGPTQIHFLPVNADEQILTQALPWSPRRGVCSCVSTTETAAYETDPVALSSAIQGRWLWCGGDGPPAGNMGIEFAAGSTWYALSENATGTITRGNGNLDHGTFEIVPTSATPTGPRSGPEPLSILLHMATQTEIAQLLFLPSPRTLLFGTGTMSGPEGPIQNDYSVCFPMP